MHRDQLIGKFAVPFRDRNVGSKLSTDNKHITTPTSDAKKPFSRPFSKTRTEKEPPATIMTTPRMGSPTPTETSTLLRQNQELRQRLQEEASSYRRRIDNYKQAQQNQAALVSRLQAKVVQYKQRCSDLENRMHETLKPITPTSSYTTPKPTTSAPCTTAPISTPSSNVHATHSHAAPVSLPCPSAIEHSPPPCREYAIHEEHDDLCRKLDDEKRRCEELIAQNAALRQQLEESNRTNEMLTNDLQKLTNDWANLRDELMAKEDEFKEEEQAFNDYCNNEHNRLLKMWRDVVSMKRSFRDMQTSVKSELGKMRVDVAGVNREISGACNNVAFGVKQMGRAGEAQQMQSERESNELKQQIANLKAQYDAARHEINQRELRLQELMQQVKMLEDRCGQAENQAIHANRLNDEVERLNAALRDIAHAVVQDAETAVDAEEPSSVQHMHLSQPGMVAPPRSPRRGSARTSQAFAEGTISAVQAALHKYQLSLHDLQVKLQSTMDNWQGTKKQLETAENTKDLLTSKVTQLTEKLDSSNSQLSELFKERDSLQRTLDTIRHEKLGCEKGKAELNALIDKLSTDIEKLQNHNGKLQKYIDGLEEDKKAMELEIQKIYKEKDITEMNLRAEEDRCSRLREETITLREELNKLYLARDLLEQNRLESDGLIAILEKQKAELEFDLDKLIMDKAELQNRLEKSSSSNDSAEEEIKECREKLTETECERNNLKTLNSDQAADIASLKKELITAEQTRLDLDAEKLKLSESLKCLELEKEKVEQELSCANRERADLHNQLTCVTRKKEAINEELMRTRQRLEQANETANRLNRNLEELVKDHEEQHVIIEGHEKELHRLQELLASLRSEKDALEAVLFDTNTTLEATEEKRCQFERDVQDLLVKEEGLKNQVARLMKELEAANRRAQELKTNATNAARAQEEEFMQKMANLKAQGDDNIKKLNEEKELIKNSLEKRMQQALQALQGNKDEEIEKLQERNEALQNQLENLVQQHDEVMIRAENEKQQALLMAHRDKQAVADKLEQVSREMKNELENGDRMRREFNAKIDKDRNAMGQLKEEMAKAKTKGEELKTQLEEEINKLEIQLGSLRDERDGANRQIDELKMEIRLKGDRIESLTNQLQDTQRKQKEAENLVDATRRDLTDARRSLGESNIERDKYANSNRELRDHIKRVEAQKREQARSLEDALQKISSLEETRNSLENEKTRLSTLLKETECNLAKTCHDLSVTKNHLHKAQADGSHKDASEKELNARLHNEIEERERIALELNNLKKQATDLEAALCATRQELGRARCNANQEEHRFHSREQELLQRLDEGRAREKCLEDQKHNLEVCLADATQQLQELKARLGGAEGRVKCLDEQLAHTEMLKKEAENKLSSIAHTLRRIAGIQFDGTVNLSYRLTSPSRRYSPVRGSCTHDFDNRSISGEAPVDVDPDLVRKGVRNLMHQVAQIEREKDDYKVQLGTAKKQLQEASELQQKCENKISKLQQQLRNCQDEKSTLESQLNTKVHQLYSVEEQLKEKTDDVNTLREKCTNLEMQLGSGAEEKGQCEERLQKCRQDGARLEAEKRQLQEELARTESRASKLDLQRVALEGDISRLQMALTERDGMIRTLEERLDNQHRAYKQLEDACASLKSTVDQLKERLQKYSLTETELRGEINALHKEKSEQGHCVQAGQDKLKQLQKTLASCENEKRILSERLDAAQTTMNELRRNQQAQQDSAQRLQEQVADLEVQKSSLESQLRIAKWNQENADQIQTSQSPDTDLHRQLMASQREKTELKSKLDALNEKVKQLESDRRSKFSGPAQFDRSEKSMYGDNGELDSNRVDIDGYRCRGGLSYSCGLDHPAIEQENRDLRLKVRRLETLLAEKEAELARLQARLRENTKCFSTDSDRYRSAQLQAEKLLDAREQAHRQQVTRLENQISMLREQVAQEAKRRQQYILRSSRANREMQHLRHTLGDSLRHVSQDPLDPALLENETRRLDNAVSLSLPPSTCHDYDRSLSPRK